MESSSRYAHLKTQGMFDPLPQGIYKQNQQKSSSELAGNCARFSLTLMSYAAWITAIVIAILGLTNVVGSTAFNAVMLGTTALSTATVIAEIFLPGKDLRSEMLKGFGLEKNEIIVNKAATTALALMCGTIIMTLSGLGFANVLTIKQVAIGSLVTMGGNIPIGILVRVCIGAPAQMRKFRAAIDRLNPIRTSASIEPERA